MQKTEIVNHRLQNQLLISQNASPAAVVRHFGAMQAQDYLAALWAVGVRTAEPTEQKIEQALAEGVILRTWPMRGTIHLVAAEDARWITELCAPRIERSATRRHRQLGLDEAIFQKAHDIFAVTLRGGKQLTRGECMQLLEEEGISTKGQRGYHILWVLALHSQLCFGPRRDRQPTFALLHEWAPIAESKPRSEALAELAKRYFRSHGPATQHDFMWWSGLTAADAKAAIALNERFLTHKTFNDTTYWWPRGVEQLDKSEPFLLLPSFDEYLIGYKDRSAMLEDIYKQHVVPGANGIFNPLIVINGQVVGTWKRIIKKDTVTVDVSPFTQLSVPERQAFEQAARLYASFIGKTLLLKNN